ncbi:MAG: formyl transferase [Deltaproteobacteria bacterium]|nr:formyl transferase [Deltaproteobacteria bacterium]
MNLVFFTQDDPFYVRVFFEEFFSLFPRRDEIKAVVVSKPMNDATVGKLARRMYDFYGPVDFLRLGTRYAGVKLRARLPAVLRGGPATVKQTVCAAGIPCWERSDLNTPEFRAAAEAVDPDLFVSVASPVIFREELIRLPRLGAVNVHSAPLPRYRGMLPNFWQLYRGEKETGITVHKIDIGLDTGDIIAQASMPVGTAESLQDVFVRSKREAARIVCRVIEDFRSGSVTYRRMEGEGSYFSFPRREHAAKLRAQGRRLL